MVSVYRSAIVGCLLLVSSKALADTEFSYSLALGTTASEVKTLLDGGDNPAAETSDVEFGPFAALGVHGLYEDSHEFGFVASYSTAAGDALWSFRPLDYRFLFSKNWRLKGFFGIARYDQETAAHGYYLGADMEWKSPSSIALGMEFAYGDKIARDRVLPSDPPAIAPDSPEIFYDMVLLNSYVAWYF